MLGAGSSKRQLSRFATGRNPVRLVKLSDAIKADNLENHGEDNVAEALDAMLTLRASELATEDASRNAMVEIAALRVSQQVSTGQGLQARIAAIK